MKNIAPPALESLRAPRRVASAAARYAFCVLFSISFVNYLDRFVLSGAANAIAKELGFGLDGIGYISSAFLVVMTLTTLPIGILADRAKRKNVVACCVAAWSIATALTALATNFTTLFISRMLLGIGEAGYFPAGTAMLSDYFHRERRSRIMSSWSVAQLIGILGGFAIGGAVAGRYTGSWRLAFIFTGLPGLLLAFLIWRAREPKRNQADEEAYSQSEFNQIPEISDAGHAIPSKIPGQIKSLLKIRTLVVLITMQVFAYFALGVNSIFLPTYLQQKDTFGLSSTAAGLYSGVVIVLAGMAGTLSGGFIADFLNRRYPGARVFVCGIGFLVAMPTFAASLLYHNLNIFTICFIITAFLLTMYIGPSTAATQDVVPSMLRASAVGVSLLIGHLLGDAFAPSLVGGLATSFDPTHGMHFKTGMAGQDLSMALLITCLPALAIAGLVGVFGSRWTGADIAAAQRADRISREK